MRRKYDATARLIVEGDGSPRNRTQLHEQVCAALQHAYDNGLAEGRKESARVPKLGAIYALESVRTTIDQTLVKLREDVA